MRMKRALGLVILVLPLMTGCFSTKIVADQSLLSAPREASGKLGQLSIGFMDSPDDPNSHAKLWWIVRATQGAKLFKRADWATSQDSWPDLLVTNFLNKGPQIGTGFQCFEPLLLIFTLGLVPAVCSNPRAISFDISRIGYSAIHIEDKITENSAIGWFALAFTPSEPGKFNGRSSAYARALFLMNAARIEQWAGVRPSVDSTNGKN